MPTQGAWNTLSKSYSPNGKATNAPTPMAKSGAQRRQLPESRRPSAARTPRVVTATTAPDTGTASSGRAVILPAAMGMTVAARSISAVPVTTGVMMRRNSGSHVARANCARAPQITSAERRPGPPARRAGTPTMMRDTLAAVRSTWPVPIRQMRPACRAVVMPQTRKVAKAAQVR